MKPVIYRFETMSVGDVFVVADTNGINPENMRSRVASSISSCAYVFRQRHAPEKRFHVRTLSGFVSCRRVA